jgi:hypothetical protein
MEWFERPSPEVCVGLQPRLQSNALNFYIHSQLTVSAVDAPLIVLSERLRVVGFPPVFSPAF